MTLAQLVLDTIKEEALLRSKQSLHNVPDAIYHEAKSAIQRNFTMSDWDNKNKYEDIDLNAAVFNETLSSYLNEAIKARNLKRLRDENIGIESITTGGANAYAFYVPDDSSYAIGVDNDILHIFMITLLSLFRIVDNPKSEQQELIAQTAQLLIQQVFSTYLKFNVEDEDRIDSIKLVMSAEQWNLGVSGYLAADYVGRFIVFHEIAHIVLNHHKLEQVAFMNPKFSHKTRISAFSHKLEFAADDWAHETLYSIMKEKSNHHATVSTLAPAVFFKFFGLVEQVLEPVISIDKQYLSSHPSAFERAYKIGKKLKKLKLEKVPEKFTDYESAELITVSKSIELLAFAWEVLDYMSEDNKLGQIAHLYLESKAQ